MAGKKTVFIDWILNDAKARAGMKKVGDEATKTQSKFAQLSGGAKALVGGFTAVVGTKIVQFLGDAAAAAFEDAKAQELLKLAIQNSTSATDLDVLATEKWIKKVSIATGVADDELRPALAELVRTTGDLSEAQDVMGVAMDIAAAKGIPLETVTKAIGKAALGNVGALGRLGVATKNADGATLTFEETLDEASRTMGGAAATAAGTLAGQLAIAKVKMDEAKESLGAALIPSIGDLAEVGGDAATIVGFLSDKIAILTGSSDTAAGANKGLWRTLVDLDPITRTVLDGMDLAADAIENAGDAAGETENPFQGVIDNMGDVAGETDEATKALQDFENEVRSQMDPIFNLTDKVNALAEAQEATSSAVAEFGRGSPEHLKTLRDEATAWLNFKDAQIRVQEESGITREKYEENLRAMGVLTSEEIDLMMADFDRLDGRVIDVTIQTNKRGEITGQERNPNIPGFAAGGVVPGPVGRPQLAVVHGGETVVPVNGKGGGGDIYIGPIYASGRAEGAQAGKAIVEEIRQYEKRNGTGWRS